MSRRDDVAAYSDEGGSTEIAPIAVTPDDNSAACVCGEINTRHCPVHGQGESVAQIRHVHTEPEVEFDVEVSAALEWGTEKPCQIGRLEYKLGAHTYVVLTFRYLTEKMPDPWFLTWVGVKDSRDTARLPEGVRPSDAMLAALAEVTG